MACCIFDCMVERPRWPRGALDRHRHRGEARPGGLHPLPVVLRSAESGGQSPSPRSASCTLIGFVVTPGDSWDFFHSKIFKPTSPTYFTNQSLEGILQRVVGGPWRIVWIVAVARRALVRVARRGRREPRWRRAARGGDRRPGECARLADLVDPSPGVGHSRARRHRRHGAGPASGCTRVPRGRAVRRAPAVLRSRRGEDGSVRRASARTPTASSASRC